MSDVWTIEHLDLNVIFDGRVGLETEVKTSQQTKSFILLELFLNCILGALKSSRLKSPWRTSVEGVWCWSFTTYSQLHSTYLFINFRYYSFLLCVPGVCRWRVWTCTVISLLCCHGPYASRRRCIMIMKHTDVGVWFCRWNMKQRPAWCAVVIWWLPSGFWNGMITYVRFQSRLTDVAAQSDVLDSFLFGLY